MSDKTSVISMMVKQHHNLQEQLGSIADILKNDPIDTENIIQLQVLFKKDLNEHIAAESKLFYSELLKEMKQRGQDITKTKQFVDEMGVLAEKVYAFLDKYEEAANISQSPDDFKKEFSQILRALNLRIESEEVGVFAYWMPADF